MSNNLDNYMPKTNTPTSVAVGLTSVKIATIPANAKEVIITNNSPSSTDTIYLCEGSTALTGKGMTLFQKGTYYASIAGRNIFVGDINAICASANGIVTVSVSV
jgi:hypothetical protein